MRGAGRKHGGGASGPRFGVCGRLRASWRPWPPLPRPARRLAIGYRLPCMAWLHRVVGAGALASAWPLAGCSDDFDPLGLGDDSTTGEPEPTFDYGACPEPMQDPSCTGSDCGLTPEAQEYLAIMLDEVAQAGHAGVFTPTRAEYLALVDELRIHYQLQVSWFRLATSVHLDVPDSEALLRQEMAAHIAGWRVPASVATPEALSLAVEGCHALLEYDPCTDNQADFYVHDRYDWSEPQCVYKSSVVVLDAADASTLECLVEEPQPCD